MNGVPSRPPVPHGRPIAEQTIAELSAYLGQGAPARVAVRVDAREFALISHARDWDHDSRLCALCRAIRSNFSQ